MKTAPMSKMPVADDEEKLWLASEKYIRGEISPEELKQVESQYSSDSMKDTQRPSVLEFLKDVLSQPFR